jgi:hypothetical protein
MLAAPFTNPSAGMSWVDYIPVYAVTYPDNKAWTSDNDGFIPLFGSFLPLDNLSAAAAYSLRRLRSDYTGAAIRVRRSSDNAELDIGFTGDGDLDTVALLRHAGENRVIQSEDLSTAAWGKSAGSSVVAAGTHNGSSAWLFTESASDLRHRVNSTAFTRPAGSAFVARVRVKDNGRQFIQILFNVGLSNLSQNFDLTNLTFGGSAGLNPTITDVGDGWRELTLTYPAAASGSGSFFIGGASSLAMARDAPYQGDGTSGFFIAQPQVTFGDLAKGYAATGAAASDGNGFITTWYEQSGNARDATQATASAQPRIVNAGVVETLGGRPAVVWSGGQVLTAAGSMFGNVRAFSSVLTFARRDETTGAPGNRCVFGNRAVSGLAQGRIFRTTTEALFTANIGQGFVSLPYVNNTPVVVSTVNTAGANLLLRADGGADASSANTIYSESPMPMQLGTDGRNTEFFVGATTEFVFFDTAIGAADRQTLERNQGAYYDITVN